MKRIAVVSTGGTIAMKNDPETGTAVPALGSEALLEAVPQLGQVAEVVAVDFFNKPSAHITFADMLGLRNRIDELLQEFDGVVVTHGTDTLEETAYFLDLTLVSDKPVIVTGAMRHPSLPSPDGPINLLNSALVATSNQAAGLGVLVCLNDEVHAARDVTKFSSTNVDAFQSPGVGPLAHVFEGAVHWRRSLAGRNRIPVREITARVALIKAAADVDSLFFQAAVDAGYQGIVLEATGAGHVPEGMLAGIELAIQRGLAVVVVSRCPIGYLLTSTYGFVGSESYVRKMGVIWGNPLNGPKARVKLVCALSVAGGLEGARPFFEE